MKLIQPMQMKSFFPLGPRISLGQAKPLISSLKNLLFPALCLHCNEFLLDPDHPLCGHCLSLMTPLEPCERCPQCFSSAISTGYSVCTQCMQTPPIFDGVAAVFDYAGPAATLIKRLKYSNKPYLAEGCGAYLAAQFLKLDWPLPDMIIPMPIAFTHLVVRGYNQSYLLAETFARLLQRPIVEALIRKSGDYSQAGLARSQRIKLGHTNFILKNRDSLEGKTLLLIDDVITTGASLNRCAESLAEAFPSKIYGLALCRAFK
jgi:competence protein ComFC